MDPLYLNYKNFENQTKACDFYNIRLQHGTSTRHHETPRYRVVCKDLKTIKNSCEDYLLYYIFQQRYVCSLIRCDEYGQELFVSAVNFGIKEYNYFNDYFALVDFFSTYSFIQGF